MASLGYKQIWPRAFLVGGSEAALTPFTIAQMQALKLYSKAAHNSPCESMGFQKTKNTMVLGEAAAVAVLEKEFLPAPWQ